MKKSYNHLKQIVNNIQLDLLYKSFNYIIYMLSKFRKNRVRRRIDKIDKQLSDLIYKRIAIATKMYKKNNMQGSEIYDPVREATITRKMSDRVLQYKTSIHNKLFMLEFYLQLLARTKASYTELKINLITTKELVENMSFVEWNFRGHDVEMNAVYLINRINIIDYELIERMSIETEASMWQQGIIYLPIIQEPYYVVLKNYLDIDKATLSVIEQNLKKYNTKDVLRSKHKWF